jgi:non-specific serine/threonine protein kinase
LLSAEQQTVFRRLAVFVGSWMLDAAEQVVPSVHEQIDVLACMAALVDHSLVIRASEIDGIPRFGMLTTIWEFAREQLEATGDAPAVQARHATWFLLFAEQQHARHLYLPGSRATAAYPDLRAALAWLHEHGDPEDHLRLASTMLTFWSADQRATEFITLATQALERGAPRESRARADLLCTVAMLHHFLGDDDQALALVHEGLSVLRAQPLSLALAWGLRVLGQLAQEQGHYEQALTHLTDALDVAHQVGATALESWIYGFLAFCASGVGEHDRARELAELAIARARSSPEYSGNLGNALNIRAVVLAIGGHDTQAVPSFGDSIRQLWEDGDIGNLPMPLAGLAHVTERLGQPDRAAILAGGIAVVCTRLNCVLFMPERALHERTITAARSTLGVERFQERFEKGRAMPLDDAVSFALDTANTLLVPATVVAPARAAGIPRLTARELDILRLIADGKPDREIAETLFISPRTVTSHVTNILNKLGVNSRSAAAAFAIRHDLV